MGRLFLSKGSHNTFSCIEKEKVFAVVIPFRKPVKQVYVLQVLKSIDAVDELREQKEDEENEDD
jgi:hypothetical protein